MVRMTQPFVASFLTAAVFALAPPAAVFETLRITEPPNPMAGTVTVPFAYTFTQQPGTGVPPYRFRLHPDSGALPLGLFLAENGVLSGTPTAYGTWIFRVMVIDGNSAAASTGQITFNANVLPMALSPGPSGGITALVNYEHQFVTTGGMPPYTYSRSGSLPTGMIVRSDGLLVGVPHETGMFAFTVRSTDVLRQAVTRSIILNVVSPAITSPHPRSPLSVGQSFSHTFTTTPGRIGSVTFERLTGFLPTGLTLSANGVLAGTPTTVGSYNSVVVATFTVGSPPVVSFHDYQQLTITVADPPLPTPMPSGSTSGTGRPPADTAPVIGTSIAPAVGATTPVSDGGRDSQSAVASDQTGGNRFAGVGGWLIVVSAMVAALGAVAIWLVRRRRNSADLP
jgi:large repetitive protein